MCPRGRPWGQGRPWGLHLWLLLAMSHGSSRTIHSPHCRVLNGRAHCHQDPKRLGCSSPKPRWCWSLIYVRGIIHAEFLSQGQTINQHVYKNILRRLMHSVREKRRKLWETRSWLLHHDNAPAHNALGIREFLGKNNVAVLEQPPCSPDLAPCDFFLFPTLKEVIKGTRFQDSEAITIGDERAPSDLGGILPGVHGSVAEEIGKVHSNPRRLLWRRHVVKFICQIK